MQLTWTDNPNTNTYVILRSTHNQGPFSYVGETTSTYSTYLDEGLTDGTTYYYRIQRVMPVLGGGDGEGICEIPGEFSGDFGGIGCTQECFSQVIAAMPNYRVRMARVPDVFAMTQEQATAALIAARLVVGNITTERTTAVPVGQVIRQDAPKESYLPQGSTVDIVMSTR